jgi:co-chaperonin GroES (HSP10)
MSVTVTGCRLLIRPFKIQEHDKVFAAARAAGIQLLESAERKEQANIDKGIVLNKGSGCHKDYTENVNPGDIIGFAKFGGKYITDPATDELLLVINDEDVICIFKED